MHKQSSQGQEYNSIDLDTYLTAKQPNLGIKTKKKFYVL